MAEPRSYKKVKYETAPEGATAIVALRLLIARAANKDSLSWWDDESLTPHATFVLQRVFPVSPNLAARSLALTAAAARHTAACPTNHDAVHLYQLDPDGQDQLASRSVSLLDVAVPEGAIATMDALRTHLLSLTGRQISYRVVRQTDSHGLQIEIPPAPSEVQLLLHRAQTLAWAYLEGSPGQPVFPFLQEQKP